MFFLFCIIGKIKTHSLLPHYETPEKSNDERPSEYDIAVAIPFSVVALREARKNELINGHALQCW
jgi:hypothetical protein